MSLLVCQTSFRYYLFYFVSMYLTPYLSALDFRILDFGVYFKLGKKSSSKPTWFFFEFELDFYCLCSLQKSISKSNWFFSFLNLIFWNWKKFEWHSISQKSSGDRQGVSWQARCYRQASDLLVKSSNQASVNLEKFLLWNLFVHTIFVVVLIVFVCACYSSYHLNTIT